MRTANNCAPDEALSAFGKGRLMRQIRNIAIAILMAALTFTALGAGTAQADDKSTAPSAKLVELPMTLACDKLDANALIYAVEHNYCTPDGKSVMSANGIVVGDCGSSWMWVFDDNVPSRAFMRYGFSSTLGAVVFRSLRVDWGNWTTGRVGGWPDSGFMSSSFYENTPAVYTGSGLVGAGLTGTVTLWWGGICGVLNPTSAEWIN